MRIESQSMELVSKSNLNSTPAKSVTSTERIDQSIVDSQKQKVQVSTQKSTVREEGKDANLKKQLEEAVSTMNELLDPQHKSAKFVFHEGLDQYYVRLIDAETEEVIKEIPPERLLDAFYEMQKLAGMIVDEKV